MAKKNKQELENTSRSVQIQLESIAQRLGTSVGQLLEVYDTPETVIEKFNTGELQLLNE